MQLPATLTLQQATATAAALGRAIAQAPASAAFEVDASTLQDFDTSAIAVLLEARREAQARGLGFVLRAAPPKLAQLSALYGVDGLIGATPA